LLGNDDLAEVANWADEIKSARPETAGWHFVDIPRSANGFSESRDCYSPQHASADHHNCVVDRIEMFQQVLGNKAASREQHIEALKFLVHLVGDLHQPLHAVGEARGGNEIRVVEFGSSQCGSRPCNLHFVWDIGLIGHRKISEKQCVARVEGIISREGLSQQPRTSPEDWANESFELAKSVWLENGGAVEEAYYRANIGIIDHRLAKAGLRLASMINETLNH
jgi:hypothetical protein